MVGETVLPLFWRSLVVAVIVLGIWTYLYKMHPLYGFIEHITLGFMTAHGLLTAFDSINRGILIPLNTNFSANILLLVPLVLGLLSFTFFVPQYLGVYRVVNGFLLAIALGVGLGTGWQTTAVGMLNYMRFSLTNLSYLVTIGATVMGSMYFVSLKRLDAPTRPLRQIATYLAAMTIGWMCGTLYIQRVAVMVGWWLDFTTSTAGWIAMAAFAIAIAVDALVGWRKILGLQPKTQTTVQA